MTPVIETALKSAQSYLNTLSLTYDLAVARMKFYHDMIQVTNDYSPVIQKLSSQSFKLLGELATMKKRK
jgi:hypothetical protein